MKAWRRWRSRQKRHEHVCVLLDYVIGIRGEATRETKNWFLGCANHRDDFDEEMDYEEEEE